MPQDKNQSQSTLWRPLTYMVIGIGLILISAAMTVLATYGRTKIIATGLTLSFVKIILYLPSFVFGLAGLIGIIIGSVRWGIYGSKSRSALGHGANDPAVAELLRSINARMLISDTVKQIAYRERDRETLRRAIREDIDKADFEAALALVDNMSGIYGYRQEAEGFRDEILADRAADIDQKVSSAITRLDQLIATHEWDRAYAEAAKIQRLYPDSHRTHNVDEHVHYAREEYKQQLERQFLEAAQRDNVDQAMDLLKEMDKFLTKTDAERFQETARGVIGKKRDNLGVQFKMTVHDKEWVAAVRIGEQIVREFPNSKMAHEVRGMLDLLRERAQSEKAARDR